MSDLDEIIAAYPAYALVRMRDSDEISIVAGQRTDLETIADLPVIDGVPAEGPVWDHLLLVPYAQVRERGFEAHQDGTPLSAIAIEYSVNLTLDRALELLPDVPLEFEDTGGFETSDDEYGELVDKVIADEIGQGEGANVGIGRHFRARVAGEDAECPMRAAFAFEQSAEDSQRPR